MAGTTVYIDDLPIMSIYAYCFSSLFQMGYNTYNRPQTQRMMRFMDFINEFAIYLSSIFCFIFTDWIDIEMRYTMGWVYLPLLISVILTNILCVLYDMGSVFYLKYKRATYKPRNPKKVYEIPEIPQTI